MNSGQLIYSFMGAVLNDRRALDLLHVCTVSRVFEYSSTAEGLCHGMAHSLHLLRLCMLSAFTTEHLRMQIWIRRTLKRNHPAVMMRVTSCTTRSMRTFLAQWRLTRGTGATHP